MHTSLTNIITNKDKINIKLKHDKSLHNTNYTAKKIYQYTESRNRA